MVIHFRVASGEQGTVRDFNEPVLTLLSRKAFSPGQPLALTLIAGDAQLALQGKTIGSKHDLEDGYIVRMKVVNLRRTDRRLLQTLFREEHECHK